MTKGRDLSKIFKRVLEAGEVPYQENRKALTHIDIYLDDISGKDDLRVMIQGLDDFIRLLEVLKSEAKSYSRTLRDTIRKR